MAREALKEKTRATLIYDGTCPICSSAVKWIKENVKEDSFEMVPCQSEVLDIRFPGMKRHNCMQALHLVLPDGTILGGEQALPEIFKKLRRHRSAAFLFKLPGAKMLSRVLYRWFADRRYRIAHFFHFSAPKK